MHLGSTFTVLSVCHSQQFSFFSPHTRFSTSWTALLFQLWSNCLCHMVGRSVLLKGMRRPNLIDCDCDRPLTISTCNVFLQIPRLPFLCATAPQVCPCWATIFGRKKIPQKRVPAPRRSTCGTGTNLHHSLCFCLDSLKEDPLWHSVGKCKNNLSKKNRWGLEGRKTLISHCCHWKVVEKVK